MRITQTLMANRVTNDLARTQQTVAKHQREVSTGQRITKPSDDAVGTRDALRRRDELSALGTYQDAAADATGWLQTTDTALQQITDVLHRARELTVKGADGATSASSRQQLAGEIASLISSAKDAGNARYGDSYVLAGHQTATAPYATATGDTYTGNSGVVARQIGPGVAVQVNTDAGTLLGSAGGDGKLLDVLRTVQAHLTANNQAGLGTDLTALDGQLDTISSVRAGLGATQNRVDIANARLQDATETATTMLGDIESVDLAEALTKLSTQQSAYTAALKSSASVLQTSLLDFLR